jgi:hypothetical protein
METAHGGIAVCLEVAYVTSVHTPLEDLPGSEVGDALL